MKYTDKIKDIKEVDKLPTKRLLSYYKARRKDRISFVGAHTCECCGETDWDLSPNNEYSKELLKDYKIIEQHLKEVKELLSKREHVKR